MVHELKIWPEYFQRIEDRTKTFEIRKNDRAFQPGDVLQLREYDPAGDHDNCADENCKAKRYTGREAFRKVGFVAAGTLFGLELGEYVVMSLVQDPR